MVGIGELLWDCFPHVRRPGGAPANVAFHANQLGMTGIVLSRVGRDDDGDELIRFLSDHGLSIDGIQQNPNHRTGYVTIELPQAADPQYTIHEDVAWDHLEFDDRWGDVVAGAAAVCFGTLAQRSPQSRASIQQALQAAQEALLVYDVNLRAPWFSREVIRQSLDFARVVKLNRAEVRIVSSLIDVDGTDPALFARDLIDRWGVWGVFVTRGANGCLAVTRDGQVDLPGEPVEVVDAVGAGDAFTAAMIHGLLQGWPLNRIARFANRVGGVVAGKEGAMPTLGDEILKES